MRKTWYNINKKFKTASRFCHVFHILEKTGFGLFKRWINGERGEVIEFEIRRYIKNYKSVNRLYQSYIRRNEKDK